MARTPQKSPLIYLALWTPSIVAICVVAVGAISFGQNCVTSPFLGTLPGDSWSRATGVSADGSVVVGVSGGSVQRAFRWTESGGMVDLGSLGGTITRANAVSGDGQVVVGESALANGSPRAFLWTAQGGMQQLPVPPGTTGSRATAVADDGATVVGEYGFGTNRAYIWSPGFSGAIAGNGSIAMDVSADASTVVGMESGIHGASAFRWTLATGTQYLGNLGGSDTRAYGVSADGSVIVGSTHSNQTEPFVWTAGTGMVLLASPTSAHWGEARSVSRDGSIVVGSSLGSGFSYALRWVTPTEFHSLGSPLQAAEAFGVSDNGNVVIGYDGAQSQGFRWSPWTKLGYTYCLPAVINSTGCAGRINAVGSDVVASNNFQLAVANLPLLAFGYFIVSRDQGATYPVNNSQGRLCLGGFIGRYVGPGQVKNSGTTGTFSLAVDLTAIPQPFGAIAVQPGETWNFQAWHRDANPNSTSNFTDAVSVNFQ